MARNSAEAARWYGRAAGQGDRIANLFLARAYWRGEGVSRNYFKAAYHFAKVVFRDFRRHGWTMLGGLVLLITGAFTPRRLWGCYEWLSLAAISIAAGMLLSDRIGTSFCFVGWHLVLTSFLGVAAILYGMGAIQGAVTTYRGRSV